MTMKLDVMAIGAHPDDVELSCGGTVIKLVKQGRNVGIVDLTQGELGTRGTKQIRAKEAARAAKILGVHVRENLRIPDGNIEATMSNRLKLVRLIRAYRPELILFPFNIDRHPDHERAHTLCREAWFAAGLEKVRTYAGGKRQDPFRPRAYYNFMQWHEFPPSFIIDITLEYEQRLEAMHAYRSQFYDPSNQKERETVLTSPEFLDMVRTRLEYYGDRIGVKYGEPFFAPATLRVDDLFTLNT
jgi:bacillithiol biosynthesis deacetylase BshB1